MTASISRCRRRSSAIQPERSAATASRPRRRWPGTPAKGWKARLSFGQAWRFPTVGELYQIVTTPVAAVPNPNLRPERARSDELALERTTPRAAPPVAVQRGGEGRADLADRPAQRRRRRSRPSSRTSTAPARAASSWRSSRSDLLPRVDLSGSVTYADATTRADAAFPAAVGKLLPTVPHGRRPLVATWRPVDGVSLTAAARYASRMYGSLDNSDVVGNTYQGFYKYLVVDLRAQFSVAKNYTLGARRR